MEQEKVKGRRIDFSYEYPGVPYRLFIGVTNSDKTKLGCKELIDKDTPFPANGMVIINVCHTINHHEELELAEYVPQTDLVYSLADLHVPLTEEQEKEGYPLGVCVLYKDLFNLSVKIIDGKTNDVIFEKAYFITRKNKPGLMENNPQKKTEHEISAKLNCGEKTSMGVIDSLIGLQSVKNTISGICTQINYEQIREQKLGIRASMECPRFLFIGNPGTGKTTVARALAGIYKRVGLLSKGQLIEVGRKDLVGIHIGETAVQTQAICASANGGVLFVDEAYDLAKDSERDYGKEAITTILTEMENHRKDFIVVFAGYKSEMEDFLKSNTGLESRITNIIHFPDYTEDELVEIAKKMARDENYTITEDGIKAFRLAINKKMVDKRFGNAREVRNLIDSAVRRRGERYMKNNSLSLTELSSADFEIDFKKDVSKSADKLIEELNSLIGLASVKEDIKETVKCAQYIMEEMDSGRMLPGEHELNMNLCFTGNPGTGKTTVARLYGQILHAVGLTKTTRFVEATRDDFVAGHIGQTASKTRETCEKAYGGVLFIDEAYAMVQDEEDSFGKEALATLIKEMEDNRDKMVVILAGYTDEMHNFIRMNSGFRSRISKFIEFPDYSTEELLKIFDLLADEHKVMLEGAARIKVAKKIQHMVTYKDKSFGNAREIRNLYETTWRHMVSRVEENCLTGADRRLIMPEDIDGVGEFEQAWAV